MPRLHGFGYNSTHPAAAVFLGYTAGGTVGLFGKPVNIAPTVNTAAGEFDPEISADGQTPYFSSDRPGGQGGIARIIHEDRRERS